MWFSDAISGKCRGHIFLFLSVSQSFARKKFIAFTLNLYFVLTGALPRLPLHPPPRPAHTPSLIIIMVLCTVMGQAIAL
jgi:hypothetical protein